MEKRKLFWILLSIIIAGIIAITIRVICSPEQLQRWIYEAINKDSRPVDFTVGKIELSLAYGAIPHLALRIIDLKIAENDSCLRNTEWRIEEAFVPLQIKSLLRGKIKIGKILASRLDIAVGKIETDGACYRPLVPPAQPVPGDESKINKSRDPQNVISAKTDLFDVISGIHVERIMVYSPVRMDRKLRITDFALSPIENRVVFGGDITIETSSLPEVAWPVIRVGGEVKPESAEIVFNGRWQEGIINLTLNLDRIESKKLKISGSLKHLPLANFLKIYERVNSHQIGSYPRSMWVTCHLNAETTVAAIKDTHFFLKDCILEGDGGTWESSALEFDLKQGTFREPYLIRISHLPLKTLLGVLQMDSFDGVLNQYGQVSGTVDVRSPGQLNFDGFIEDMEVYFSNAGVRAHQMIQRARLQLEKSEGRVSGMFSEFELRKGSLKGSVSLNFDKRFQDGSVQMQMSELTLDPSVQELLVKDKLGKIEFYGKFKISRGSFDVFKGDLGIASVENQNIRSHGIKVSASYISQALALNITTKEIELNTSSQYYDFFKPLLFDKKFLEPWIEVTDLAVNITGRKSYLEWKKGRAQIASERVMFSSEGIWQEGAGLSGWISVDFPSLKLLRWDISGELLSPRLLPSSQWLKELVKEPPKKSR